MFFLQQRQHRTRVRFHCHDKLGDDIVFHVDSVVADTRPRWSFVEGTNTQHFAVPIVYSGTARHLRLAFFCAILVFKNRFREITSIVEVNIYRSPLRLNLITIRFSRIHNTAKYAK